MEHITRKIIGVRPFHKGILIDDIKAKPSCPDQIEGYNDDVIRGSNYNIPDHHKETTRLLSHSENEESTMKKLQRILSRSRSLSQQKIYSGSQSSSGTLARSTSITRINTTDLISGETDEKVPSLWSSSKSQFIVLASLFLCDILLFMCLSIMAPFFPIEAEAKGMSFSVSGWVFGMFSFVQFCFAPVVGKLIPIVGSRFLFLSGTFFGGGCTILFGLLNRVPVYEDNNITFTVLCFVLRIFLALGCTAASTATFAIATNAFPHNASTALGFLETAIGLGAVLGPALGGILYEIGGFNAPFTVVGTSMIIAVPFFCLILPADDGNCKQEEPSSIIDLLKVPVIDLILLTLCVSGALWMSLEPILEPHLRQFDLSPAEVGLVFLLVSGTYALLAPLAGWISDRVDNTTPLLIIGFVVLTIAFSLLGPSPLLFPENYNKLWLSLVSLILIGIGVSMTVVPTFAKILTAAEKAGIPPSVGTHAAVAGLWTSIFALGEFIGPVYAGAAYEAIGLGMAMTYIAIVTFVMIYLTIFIYIYEKKTCCFRETISQYSPMPEDSDNSMKKSAP